MTARLASLVVVLLAVSACGDDRVAGSAETTIAAIDTIAPTTSVGPVTSIGTTTTGAGLPTISEMECADGGECAYGFMLGDEFVEVSCEAVKPELVTDKRIAMDGGTSASSLSVIAGVDPTMAGAVHDTMCTDVEWSIANRGLFTAFSDEATAATRARVRCDVLVEPQVGDRCDTGGSATWSLSEYDADMHVGNGWAFFPEWIDAMDAGASADPSGPEGWRLDPLQVAVRQLLDSESVGSVCEYRDLYPGCRVLLRSTPREGAEPGTIDFDGILQWIVPMNEPEELFAETYPIRITVRQDGATWWPSRYQEGPNTQHGPGDAGKAAAGEASAGFDTVVVEWQWPLTDDG